MPLDWTAHFVSGLWHATDVDGTRFSIQRLDADRWSYAWSSDCSPIHLGVREFPTFEATKAFVERNLTAAAMQAFATLEVA